MCLLSVYAFNVQIERYIVMLLLTLIELNLKCKNRIFNKLFKFFGDCLICTQKMHSFFFVYCFSYLFNKWDMCYIIEIGPIFFHSLFVCSCLQVSHFVAFDLCKNALGLREKSKRGGPKFLNESLFWFFNKNQGYHLFT